jgi:short-subunit dehydrogenase
MTLRDVVLITGASSGIGRALAQVFAQQGHNLVLVARSQDKLRALAQQLSAQCHVAVTPVTLDLTRPGAARSLFRNLSRRQVAVEVLVNNAGMLSSGGFDQITLRSHLALLQLNAVVPTELTQLFLKPMLERGRGKILNVASIAAFQPLERLAVYAATKAYLLHFTEALSEELRGTGVTATALCPGFTDTNMMSAVRDRSWLPAFAVSSAEEVASDAYRACMSGAPVYVSGATNQMLTQLMRHQPRWLVRALSGWASRKYA